MEFTFTIDDSIAKRVIQDVCNKLSYSDTLSDGNPNPETPVNFVTRSAANYLIGAARQQEVDDVTRAQIATADAAISTQKSIIESELTIQVVVTKDPPALPQG